MLPDFDRVGAIQSYWSNPETRNFGELLIDCEEDRALRAVLVGMLPGARGVRSIAYECADMNGAASMDC